MKKTKREALKELPKDGFHEYLVFGSMCWGRDPNFAKARKRHLKAGGGTEFKYFIVPKGAYINEIGTGICWSEEEAGIVHSEGFCPACYVPKPTH